MQIAHDFSGSFINLMLEHLSALNVIHGFIENNFLGVY